MVFVVGLGVRSPFGVGAGALLEGLSRARAVFETYPPFVAAGVRAPVAAVVPDAVLFAHANTARAGCDRGAVLLEGAVRDALEDATGRRTLAEIAGLDPRRVALVAGTSSAGIGRFCEAQAQGTAVPDDGARYSSAVHRVARELGVAGPVLVVCNVCASGALAVAEAAELVQSGAVDVALAGGFDPLEPFVGVGFDSLGALCEKPTPFRAGRRGLALGEASAALLLVRAPSTVDARRTRGCVLGWGSSADAHHLTAPDPRGAGVVLAVERALARAGLGREAIGVINAHGTGTPFNDAMESAALATVFGPRAGGRWVYTVKGTIGHTLGAAGALEAVTALAAMEAQLVPPTVTAGALDPACDLDVVTETARPCDAGVTLSLSSAFGGTNCALVLGSAAAGAAWEPCE